MHRTGTAGWSLRNKPTEPGSHLYHYSRSLTCVEVNSSFYRAHRPATWARWASETPADFRFSIKAPKTITHEHKLRDPAGLLKAFLEQIEPMQDKTGPILFQLPPSLSFETPVAEDFFGELRGLYQGEVAVEPRHESWFQAEVDRLLKQNRIARVAADPPKGASAAAEPGGASDLIYYRLHGSPRTYYSNYEDSALERLADRVRLLNNVWIIFDNTALSHAYPNALRFERIGQFTN